MKIVRLYYNTICHLKFRQIVYLIWYKMKWTYLKYNYTNTDIGNIGCTGIDWDMPSILNDTHSDGKLSFTFLNKEKTFQKRIDWTYKEYGKLWNYHLQYLDCLLDERLKYEDRLDILIQITAELLSGRLKLESYPVSKRLINTLIFIHKYSIRHNDINQSVGLQILFLKNNLEYHLLANHLLENLIALSFAYCAIDHTDSGQKYVNQLMHQLDEQILTDGAHYERTPAYHAQILTHLLQLIYLLDKLDQHSDIRIKIREVSSKMLGWYKKMCSAGMPLPLLNDSAESNMPAYLELKEIADKCDVTANEIVWGQCGYRMLKNERLTVIVNCGNMSPSYQPGHAHSDMMHFVLYDNQRPVFVDAGISTYEKNERRLLERTTGMHNTVSYTHENQSQLWASFRVGKRAVLRIIEERENELKAEVKWHNGMIHQRYMVLNENALIIEDKFLYPKFSGSFPKSNFHMDHTVKDNVQVHKDSVQVDTLKMQFYNHRNIAQENYLQSRDFNKQFDAIRISAYFTDELKTVISWTQ